MLLFQLLGQNLSNGIDVKLVFKNNSADDAGNVLHGGTIDNCKLTHGLDLYSSGKVFDMLVHNNDTITTQLQTFPVIHFKYAHVKLILQTAVSLRVFFLAQCILWLQLNKEMEHFLVL